MFYYLITIDTEEEGLWGGAYKRHHDYTVENIRYLQPFQEFCSQNEIHPTYLIDYPVAINKTSADILRKYLQDDQCEIGTHLHPWCNPPYEEELNTVNSYTNNLPTELQYKKMKVLTDTIEDNFGIHPVSYRAGRYGFDEKMIPILESLKYKIDTSVVPLRNNGIPGEPVFDLVPLNPYPLNHQNVCSQGDSSIIEIPITVGFTRRLPSRFKKSYNDLPNIGIRRVLRTFFKIDLVWLRPSYASLENMKRLVDNLARENVFILNMMFHSSELMPEGSKYNQSQEDVDQFLEKIKAITKYITSNYETRGITLKDVLAIK